LFFIQQSPKDALGKLSFLHYVVSRKQGANRQKQLWNVIHVKAGQSAKGWLDPAKNKNRPKMLHTSFLHESLQLLLYA